MLAGKSLQYFIYGAFSIDSDSVLFAEELCYNQFNVTHYGGGKRKELRLYNTGSGIGSYISLSQYRNGRSDR